MKALGRRRLGGLSFQNKFLVICRACPPVNPFAMVSAKRPLLDTNRTAPVVSWATEGWPLSKFVADETSRSQSPQGSPSPCPVAPHQQSPVFTHGSNLPQKARVSGKHTGKFALVWHSEPSLPVLTQRTGSSLGRRAGKLV